MVIEVRGGESGSRNTVIKDSPKIIFSQNAPLIMTRVASPGLRCPIVEAEVNAWDVDINTHRVEQESSSTRVREEIPVVYRQTCLPQGGITTLCCFPSFAAIPSNATISSAVSVFDALMNPSMCLLMFDSLRESVTAMMSFATKNVHPLGRRKRERKQEECELT